MQWLAEVGVSRFSVADIRTSWSPIERHPNPQSADERSEEQHTTRHALPLPIMRYIYSQETLEIPEGGM